MPSPDRLLSLNEVETLGAKAARGAGLAWGLAEDVGRGARWMAERGVDWTLPLLRLTGSAAPADAVLRVARLADLLAGAEQGTRWTLDAAEPVWALAILSGALRGRDLTLEIAWAAAVVRLHGDGGANTDADVAGLGAAGPRDVTVTVVAPGASEVDAAPTRLRRSRVPVAALQGLEHFCARTYVAASTQSRATGAGGGRVDDD